MKSKWSLRKRGLSFPVLWRRLDEAAKQNISYRLDPILGFPGTAPTKESIEVLRRFSLEHPSNIGFHTTDRAAELGFPGTQELEREFIYRIGALVGADDPEAQIDGYVCMGGTEGNDHGLWLGRNKLNHGLPNPQKMGIAVLASFLAHYSIAKHFGRLFPPSSDGSNKHCLNILPTNSKGEMTADIVEGAVRKLWSFGYRKFLIVLTAGTTNLGSVDQIPEISGILDSLKKELGISAYIHVDAAFGGFVLPFLEPDYRFGFQNELVGSLSLDAHKMGYTPYSSGVFLCRKGFLKYTETPATYLGCHADSTVCGSRSGSIPAACLANLYFLGQKGYSRKLSRCLENLQYLKESIQALHRKGMQRIRFYPSRMNVLTVWLPKEIADALQKKKDGELSIRERFCIPYDDSFPSDLKARIWNPEIKGKRTQVFRFVVMPHVTRKKIDRFINELKKAIGRR